MSLAISCITVTTLYTDILGTVVITNVTQRPVNTAESLCLHPGAPQWSFTAHESLCKTHVLWICACTDAHCPSVVIIIIIFIIKVFTCMIKKKFIGEFTVSSFLHREVFTHSHKKQTWVTKNNQCINWRSKASRWRWRGRSWRGILSVTICRWRSHPSGLGFWFWAATIVSAGGFSLDERSCPGWGAPGLAACSASCTGPPSCPTPWRRRSCGSRSPWSWSHSLPPRCGSPRLSAKCSPGSRPRYNRQERR